MCYLELYRSSRSLFFDLHRLFTEMKKEPLRFKQNQDQYAAIYAVAQKMFESEGDAEINFGDGSHKKVSELLSDFKALYRDGLERSIFEPERKRTNEIQSHANYKHEKP